MNLPTINKYNEIDMNISVNNNHMIKHVTLTDITST